MNNIYGIHLEKYLQCAAAGSVSAAALSINARRLVDRVDYEKEKYLCDPFGKRIKTEYDKVDGTTVWICAKAFSECYEKYPLKMQSGASSYGIGQLLTQALEDGFSCIELMLDKNTIDDGALGIASCFGYYFLDENGFALDPIVANIGWIRHIDYPLERPQLPVRVNVICSGQKCDDTGDLAIFRKILKDKLMDLFEVVNRDMKINVAEWFAFDGCFGMLAGMKAFLGAEINMISIGEKNDDCR